MGKTRLVTGLLVNSKWPGGDSVFMVPARDTQCPGGDGVFMVSALDTQWSGGGTMVWWKQCIYGACT